MMTNCEQYEQLFAGSIKNELTPAEQQQLDQHLATCASCREELAVMKQLWVDMGVIETPVPSRDMEVMFHAMLDTFKNAEAERFNLLHWLQNRLNTLWYWQPRMKIAYQLAIIAISFAGGYWMFKMSKGSEQDQQLKALNSQVHELKQTMVLALMENPSASERIRGVSYTSQMKHADQQVIDALFATLNNDPNVNVRLSTLDALTQLAGHPEVREGLVKSITEQDSPLMQSAIADVMLKLQEKSSVTSFRQLLKQKNLDNGVRDKIQETIKSLI